MPCTSQGACPLARPSGFVRSGRCKWLSRLSRAVAGAKRAGGAVEAALAAGRPKWKLRCQTQLLVTVWLCDASVDESTVTAVPALISASCATVSTRVWLCEAEPWMFTVRSVLEFS